MIKDLFRSSFLYAFVSVTERGLLFLLTPILVALVSKKTFGDYSYLLTIESVFLPLVSINLYGLINREYYDEGFDLREFVLSSTIFSALIVIVLGVIILCISDGGEFLDVEVHLVLFSLGIALMNSLIISFQTFYRLEKLVAKFALLSIGVSLLYLFSQIVIAYVFRELDNMYVMRFFVYVSIALLLIGFILKGELRNVLMKLSITRVIARLRISLPLALFSLSAFLFVMSDRIFIKYLMSSEDLAVYAASYQFAALLSVASGAFVSAWTPWLYDRLSENYRAIRLKRLFFGLSVGWVLFGGISSFILPWLTHLVLPLSYRIESFISYLFISSFVFQGIYNIYNPILLYFSKTKYNAYIGVIAALTNVAMNWILIPRLGLVGAAIGTSIGWFVMMSLFITASLNVLNKNYE